jgi:hypothetical protein
MGRSQREAGRRTDLDRAGGWKPFCQFVRARTGAIKVYSLARRARLPTYGVAMRPRMTQITTRVKISRQLRDGTRKIEKFVVMSRRFGRN